MARIVTFFRRSWLMPVLMPVLVLTLQGGCSQPPCPQRPTSQFVDPEIARLTPAEREADLQFLRSLLEDAYPHLAEKKRRFGVRVVAVIAAHREALGKAVNRYEYMNAVDRMLLAFHDGHLTSRGYGRTFRNTYRAPLRRPRPRARPRPSPVLVGVGLRLRYVAGQIVVTRVRPGSSGDRAGVKPGDVLLLVGDRPALSRVGASLRWHGWSRINAGLQLAASRVMINRPWYPDTPMPTEHVLIQRGSRRLQITLVGRRTPALEERAFGFRLAHCPGPAKTPVGILRVGTFGGAPSRVWRRITALLQQARKAKALILDLRGNRGGSQGVAHKLVSHLISTPVVAGEYRYLRSPIIAKGVPIIRSLKADPSDPRWTIWRKDLIRPARADAPAALRMPVAALVDEVCASSCETVARALASAPGIELYGRPTAGSSGLPIRVTLPHSRLIISLPTWQSRTVDGRPIEGYGVPPHHLIPLRIRALAAGRDEPVEQSLAALCKRLASGRPAR